MPFFWSIGPVELVYCGDGPHHSVCLCLSADPCAVAFRVREDEANLCVSMTNCGSEALSTGLHHHCLRLSAHLIAGSHIPFFAGSNAKDSSGVQKGVSGLPQVVVVPKVVGVQS